MSAYVFTVSRRLSAKKCLSGSPFPDVSAMCHGTLPEGFQEAYDGLHVFPETQFRWGAPIFYGEPYVYPGYAGACGSSSRCQGVSDGRKNSREGKARRSGDGFQSIS
jgi:hypothetical protein